MNTVKTRTEFYVGLSIGVVVVALVIWAVLGIHPAAVAAPSGYTPYSSPEHTFTCSGPAGWDTFGESANGIAQGVVMKSGSARIHIVTDLQSSLMADIPKVSDEDQAQMAKLFPGSGLLKQPPPVETLHKVKERELQNTLSGYEEQPATAFHCAAGDARVSEFTANGGMLDGKLHGYRVTILGSQRAFTVVCRCRESDWANLKPAFITVINSVRPGNG